MRFATSVTLGFWFLAAPRASAADWTPAERPAVPATALPAVGWQAAATAEIEWRTARFAPPAPRFVETPAATPAVRLVDYRVPAAELPMQLPPPTPAPVPTKPRLPVPTIPTTVPANYTDDEPASGPRLTLSADYLRGWVRRGTIPVLATTARSGEFGYLGRPGTENLVGPGGFGSTSRDGFRLRGSWSPVDSVWGLDGDFFTLGRRGDAVNLLGGPTDTIARPFISPNVGSQYAELVSYPGISTGSLEVRLDSHVWSIGANLRRTLAENPNGCVGLLFGYRHLDLSENLYVRENLYADSNAPDPAGTRVAIEDAFRVRNRFHGANFGTILSRDFGRWTLDARAAIALGGTVQESTIAGITARRIPGTTTELLPAGILASGNHLGTRTTTRFAAVPEAGLTVGFRITPAAKVRFGYDVVYWPSVARPGDQVPTTIDLTAVPNSPLVPASAVGRSATKATDFWAQGLHVGLEVGW